jgi:hypothetical protein
MLYQVVTFARFCGGRFPFVCGAVADELLTYRFYIHRYPGPLARGWQRSFLLCVDTNLQTSGFPPDGNVRFHGFQRSTRTFATFYLPYVAT